MAHNIKSIREKFRANGVFYSDERMAAILRDFMPKDATEVYDPTCGDGGLLAVFPDEVHKYGQELDAEQARVASERLVNADIVAGDTLTAPAFIGKRFRAIVANPPFSVKWTPPADPKKDPVFADAPTLPPPGKADYAFLLHILHLLADDGVAAVVNFPGICYRGQREGKLREWIIERNLIDRIILMEKGYFVDTDTMTVILVLKKNRSEDYITMRDNALDIERRVTLDEIRENGYSLNVPSYVSPPEPEKPKVNSADLEFRARNEGIRQIRAHIEFSAMVAFMEGWSFDPFLDQIQDLIDEYRHKDRTKPV